MNFHKLIEFMRKNEDFFCTVLSFFSRQRIILVKNNPEPGTDMFTRKELMSQTFLWWRYVSLNVKHIFQILD